MAYKFRGMECKCICTWPRKVLEKKNRRSTLPINRSIDRCKIIDREWDIFFFDFCNKSSLSIFLKV